MKEYTITYKSTEGDGIFVGSGYGKNEAEAVADFAFWHGSECVEIISVVAYK